MPLRGQQSAYFLSPQIIEYSQFIMLIDILFILQNFYGKISVIIKQ